MYPVEPLCKLLGVSKQAYYKYGGIPKQKKAMQRELAIQYIRDIPNLIKDFISTAPNQLWVSDITYIVIWTSGYEYQFCYLFLVMDSYSKMFMGWSVGET